MYCRLKEEYTVHICKHFADMKPRPRYLLTSSIELFACMYVRMCAYISKCTFIHV